MLDLRWVPACLLLLGCPDAVSETVDVTPEANVKDAAVGDARRPAARVHDARVEAAPDAAKPDAAGQPVDASVAIRSWMDVPAGPARNPREVCARTWQVPGRQLSTGFGIVPIARLFELRVDGEGNTWVTGTLTYPFDFGTGELPVPEAQASAYLLKLDAACNLLWAHSFLPAAGRTLRTPAALGFDPQRRLVLVTSSSEGDANQSVEFVTLDAVGDVVAEKVLPVGDSPPGTASVSRDGHVLFSGTAHANALDFGAGPLRDQQFNVLFDAAGTLLRQDVLATSSRSLQVAQRVSTQGELFATGRDIATYYGTSFAGATIAKIDRTGTLAWKRELYAQEPATLDDFKLDVGEDGSIALWTLHGYDRETGAEQRLRELAPDGTPRWDVPITRDGKAFLHAVRMGKESVAAYGAITGATRVGNTALRFGDAGQREMVLQVEHGGALRWALLLAETDWVQAIDLNTRDEVVVAGYGSAVGELYAPMFVRAYAADGDGP